MLFGDSDAMRTIQRTIHQLRNNDTTSVLITGETGVGKEWEFSHKVIGGGHVHDATEGNAGSPITIPSGGSRSYGKLIRTGVEHLPEDEQYIIKAYTAVRINPPQGAQLFAEGEDDGEEFSFWR